MSAAAPIPYIHAARVSGLRRIATVPNGDHELVYLADTSDPGDVLRLEFATRVVKGREARCLVGARIVEKAVMR